MKVNYDWTDLFGSDEHVPGHESSDAVENHCEVDEVKSEAKEKITLNTHISIVSIPNVSSRTQYFRGFNLRIFASAVLIT